MTSKLTFRARMLDATKPLSIYQAVDLPELAIDYVVNRAVSALPTGMEKEEEAEKHLQDILEAQNKGLVKKVAELVIPTPEVMEQELQDSAYNELYKHNFKQPRQYIHMQPFGVDQEMPDYDMDDDDERFFNDELIDRRKFDVTRSTFEDMIDRLEKNSGQTVVSLREAKMLLKEDDDLILAVYDYWLNKRLETQQCLIPQVKSEVRDGTSGGSHNPYIAFRRRTEKMQTRKNRKNDEVSYEKMLKLRRDINRAVMLLELIKRREKIKKEKLVLIAEVFEKRYQTKDYSGEIISEVASSKQWRVPPQWGQHQAVANWANSINPLGTTIDLNQVVAPGPAVAVVQAPGVRKEKKIYKKKKRHLSSRLGFQFRVGDRPAVLSSLLSSEPMSSDDDRSMSSSVRQSDMETDSADNAVAEGPFTFRRRAGVQYHAPLLEEEDPGPPVDQKFGYRVAAVPFGGEERCLGYCRRRVGRGGRVVVDRLASRWDQLWERPGTDLAGDVMMVRPVTPVNIRDDWDIVRAAAGVVRS